MRLTERIGRGCFALAKTAVDGAAWAAIFLLVGRPVDWVTVVGMLCVAAAVATLGLGAAMLHLRLDRNRIGDRRP